YAADTSRRASRGEPAYREDVAVGTVTDLVNSEAANIRRVGYGDSVGHWATLCRHPIAHVAGSRGLRGEYDGWALRARREGRWPGGPGCGARFLQESRGDYRRNGEGNSAAIALRWRARDSRWHKRPAGVGVARAQESPAWLLPTGAVR